MDVHSNAENRKPRQPNDNVWQMTGLGWGGETLIQTEDICEDLAKETEHELELES